MLKLAKHFHVFAIDVRGQEGGSWTLGHDAWGMVSIDVAEFVEAVVGWPIIISGNSSGGIIALRCASRVNKWVKADM
ncbi:alpha/beta fold hydrolase [Actinomyces sp. oral taxon 849]|uniref:alpha/beta fold hydrolase n=1 Tax=Actinomyces sp. oral taxon 849 TaxID=653385 RepID=UPI0018DC4B66|nr:alpha/beta fold hydrolase [Actinomyces sp. oral taxon 849]